MYLILAVCLRIINQSKIQLDHQAEFEVKARPQKRSENLTTLYIQRVYRNVVVSGMCSFNNQYMEQGRHMRD